jgi:hypothetical protein
VGSTPNYSRQSYNAQQQADPGIVPPPIAQNAYQPAPAFGTLPQGSVGFGVAQTGGPMLGGGMPAILAPPQAVYPDGHIGAVGGSDLPDYVAPPNLPWAQASTPPGAQPQASPGAVGQGWRGGLQTGQSLPGLAAFLQRLQSSPAGQRFGGLFGWLGGGQPPSGGPQTGGPIPVDSGWMSQHMR